MTQVRMLELPRRPERRRVDAQPILKWAGGKTRLLSELVPRLPERHGRFFEPFFGGGALFFAIQPEDAWLSDINFDLVNVYRCVQDDVEALIEDLRTHRYEKDYYYAMRALNPEELSPIKRASRMIYLNRTCFNGLYRVNRRGQFNVPMGRYKNPAICRPELLRAAGEALRGAEFDEADYRRVLDVARAGDFVYFDPPYQPLSSTANFTSYTRGAFGEEDQRDLAAVFAELDRRGVYCMLSNSHTPLIRELYGAWRLEIVLAPRAISRNGAGRQPVEEVVARNY